MTEDEYNAALKRIDELIDAAPPGSPDADEFYRLVTAVHEYENEHFPTERPSAEVMAEFRHEQEGEAAELTEAYNMAREALAVYVDDKGKPPTPEQMRRRLQELEGKTDDG